MENGKRPRANRDCGLYPNSGAKRTSFFLASCTGRTFRPHLLSTLCSVEAILFHSLCCVRLSSVSWLAPLFLVSGSLCTSAFCFQAYIYASKAVSESQRIVLCSCLSLSICLSFLTFYCFRLQCLSASVSLHICVSRVPSLAAS